MFPRLARQSLLALILVLPGCGDGPSAPAPLRILSCASGSRYAIGETKAGSLSADDCVQAGDDVFADYYQFSLPSAGPVTIELESTVISGPLVVILLRGSGGFLESESTSPQRKATIGGELSAGTYIVIVHGQQPGRIGGYTLRSNAALPPPFDCARVTAHTVGTTANGTLSSTDCADPYGFSAADYHRLTLSTAGPVSVVIRSTSGTSPLYVVLYNSREEELDYATAMPGGSGTVGAASLPPGTYYIMVASTSQGATASYTITSSASPPPPFNCAAITPYAIAATVSGTLTTSDCRDPGGYDIADYYRVTLATAGPVSIVARSTGSVPLHLTLFGADESTLDGEGIGPGGSGTVGGQLAAGTYFVMVGAMGGAPGGTYTLTSTATLPPLFDCPTIPPYAVGSTVNGTISATDCLDPIDLAFADYFDLTVATLGPVSITLAPPATGEMIIALSNGEGNFIGFATARPGVPGVVGGMLLPGRYVVVIAGTAAGQTGSYTFTSSATLPAVPGRVPFLGCTTTQQYTIGVTVTGSLGPASCYTTNGNPLVRHDFTLSEARTVTIDLQSTAFDAFLYVFDAAGTIIAQNDDDGGSGNSRLTLPLQPGTYSIGASAFLGGATGNYTLTSR